METYPKTAVFEMSLNKSNHTDTHLSTKEMVEPKSMQNQFPDAVPASSLKESSESSDYPQNVTISAPDIDIGMNEPKAASKLSVLDRLRQVNEEIDQANK